jgi:hypothetical protein
MKVLGDVGHVKSHFFPFGDSVSVGARYVKVCAKRAIGLEIILDHLMVPQGDVAQVKARSVWR